MQRLMKLLAVAVVAALASAAAGTAQAERLTFMTGPAGGTWYPLGGAIKRILEEGIPDLQLSLRPGAGLINIKAIEIGKAELAMGHVISTVDAIAGNPPFEKPHQDLCNLGALYQQVAHIVTIDQEIHSIADFRGKSITSLPRGNTNEFALRMLLGMYDMTYDDLGTVNFASITDMVNLMKDGHAVALSLITSLPSGSIMDLANARDVRFLDVPDTQFERLKARNGGWSRIVIPAETYEQERDTVSAGFPMQMMASCSRISDDLAYAMTKALAEHVQELASINAALATHDAAAMAADIGVPFHPGAERYYREVGVR